MPILKSAKKALRQSERRRKRNLQNKNAFKKAAKDIRKLLGSNKIEEAKQLMPAAYRALDKAAKTGVIKSGKAGRLKSRLAKRFTKTTSSK